MCEKNHYVNENSELRALKMTELFNMNEKPSWYFGQMSREDATELLMSEREGGVFLVRDSRSIRGDYVLCVREDCKVSHYIINKVQQDNQTRYHIGDQFFNDLLSLIEFYKLHYLNTTPLIRPAPRALLTVKARYDFRGNDADDLPFKRGDILTVISKDEEQWWTAKNSQGQIGSIPVPYVEIYEGPRQQTELRESIHPAPVPPAVNNSSENSVKKMTTLQKKLPAFARVKQARTPNAYDKTALKLEVGDVIKVTKMNINGQWEGELNGKVGHFPFTHVEFNSESNDGEGEN